MTLTLRRNRAEIVPRSSRVEQNNRTTPQQQCFFLPGLIRVFSETAELPCPRGAANCERRHSDVKHRSEADKEALSRSSGSLYSFAIAHRYDPDVPLPCFVHGILQLTPVSDVFIFPLTISKLNR